MGAACELAESLLLPDVVRIRSLRDRLEKGLFARLDNLALNGPADPEQRLPNTLNLSFAGVSGESLLLNLDLKGIAASSGSACSSGSLEASHVLTAMGIDPVRARSSVRFSLGLDNHEKEIDYLLEELPAIVERLRKMGPSPGNL